MNTGKSLKILLIKCGKSQTWLASELAVSRQQVCNWCANSVMSGNNINDICKLFKIKASQFIALGEGSCNADWLDRGKS